MSLTQTTGNKDKAFGEKVGFGGGWGKTFLLPDMDGSGMAVVESSTKSSNLCSRHKQVKQKQNMRIGKENKHSVSGFLNLRKIDFNIILAYQNNWFVY
jgi:hypothetical protein